MGAVAVGECWGACRDSHGRRGIADGARRADRPWWLAAARVSAGLAALLAFVVPLRRPERDALLDVRPDAVEMQAELAAARRNLLEETITAIRH